MIHLPAIHIKATRKRTVVKEPMANETPVKSDRSAEHLTHRQYVTPRHQSGTAMSEYLIGTVGVSIALFAPIPGLNQSVFMFMVEALRGLQAHTTYVMSLP